MQENPHVVYGVDSKYVPPALVSIYSICKASPGPLKATICTTEPDDVNLEHARTLEKHFSNLQIEILPFDPAPLKEYELTRKHRFSAASMLPLFVPWLIEGRCLLLDADTVALQDISELYNTDLKGFPIGACQASSVAFSVRKHSYFGLGTLIMYPRSRKKKQQITEWAKRIGFTIDELQTKYFVTSPLLLDNDLIRKMDPQRDLTNVKASKPLWDSLPDMDIYNVFFKDKVCYLDLKWDVNRDFVYIIRKYSSDELWRRVIEAAKNPAIYHYPVMYRRLVWKRPWYKTRKRHKIYRDLCHEMQELTGINIVAMLDSLLTA